MDRNERLLRAAIGPEFDAASIIARNANSPHLHIAAPEARPKWPEPNPIESSLPSVKALDPELLPAALRDYVLDVSDRQQAPPDFAAVAGLCGVAALAGNDVRIRPKANDDWEVTPNLWGAVIGRPSAMKSPAMRAALGPVYALQEHARTDWETAKKEREIDAALHGIGAKDAAKEAAKAMKAGDRERARNLLAEHMNGSDDEAACPRLIVNDATVEKLGELLNENKHGLLLVRDELAGFLARLDAEDAQSERAFYLEAFNGDGAFTYDRIGRGTIHIERATVSIIGGIQPSRVAPLVRGAVTGSNDDGLLQRFQLAVWPDDLRNWTWTDRRPNARARLAYEAAFQAVEIYARNLEAPAVFQFSAEAQDLFRQWMIELQTEARGRKLPSVYESHLLKMPKTVAGLALLFELIEGGRESVGAIATGRALDWADYLKSHASRLYAGGAIMAENGARLISERRDQLPERFTARDVQRKAWAGLYDRDAVADALDLLVSANHVRSNAVASGEAGGRPSTVYEWNPKLGVEG
jgi:hypothetical protein